MLRFIYVILLNLFRAPYMIPKMRREADHPEKYSAEERYELARHCIRLMKVTGGIHTKAYGQENLPKEGGYMMYPNHQGKYDALGIVYTHRKPCSIVMDKAKSNTILVKEFIDLLEGKRLDFLFHLWPKISFTTVRAATPTPGPHRRDKGLHLHFPAARPRSARRPR